jgi:hypothetical protein
MIMGEQLARWCADRGAQRGSVEAIAKVARKLEMFPALVRLRENLDSLRGADAEAVLRLAQSFLEAADGAPEMLNSLIKAAAADSYFRPPCKLTLSEVNSGLLLFDQPALTITLAAMDADAIAAKRAARNGSASLVFTGRRSLFHFIRTGGAVLSFWEAPPIELGFTAGMSGRCRFVERRRLEDGETIAVDGRRRTFVVEEAAHDLVYLQATTGLEAAPLTAEYDSETLRFVGASSNDEAASRIQMMLTLLRTMGRRDAVPVFRQMLSSEHFYARWQAMREFLALDAAAALPHLRAMAAIDPHAEVREAAAATLAHFFPEDAPFEEEIACLA